MCGCGLKPNLATSPARSIMRAKPAVVNGAPRSEVNTKGDFGSWSRCSLRRARISSPRIGCVAGVPFLVLRTASVAVTPAVGLGGLDELVHLGLGQVFPGPQFGVGRAARGNCSVYGGWRYQFQARFCHGNQPSSPTTVRKSSTKRTVCQGALFRWRLLGDSPS